mmetsp:Transcript_37919/g.82457  ORF Transcript_37919/g.82457 Transcript_37919/m.82457 type:complete len:202 (-) Transcript_37919:200-805(-)
MVPQPSARPAARPPAAHPVPQAAWADELQVVHGVRSGAAAGVPATGLPLRERGGAGGPSAWGGPAGGGDGDAPEPRRADGGAVGLPGALPHVAPVLAAGGGGGGAARHPGRAGRDRSVRHGGAPGQGGGAELRVHAAVVAGGSPRARDRVQPPRPAGCGGYKSDDVSPQAVPRKRADYGDMERDVAPHGKAASESVGYESC